MSLLDQFVSVVDFGFFDAELLLSKIENKPGLDDDRQTLVLLCDQPWQRLLTLHEPLFPEALPHIHHFVKPSSEDVRTVQTCQDFADVVR